MFRAGPLVSVLCLDSDSTVLWLSGPFMPVCQRIDDLVEGNKTLLGWFYFLFFRLMSIVQSLHSIPALCRACLALIWVVSHLSVQVLHHFISPFLSQPMTTSHLAQIRYILFSSFLFCI